MYKYKNDNKILILIFFCDCDEVTYGRESFKYIYPI